ncbi:MAG: glycosyl hydrolase [Kiritimatiellia bacterium]|jgi:hypothetical protein|nr:glycosyl hydrolase [Kiritimatiellia bacterium]
MKRFKKGICGITAGALGVIFAAGWVMSSAWGADKLAQGFAEPPDSAKPQTWWHWADGNIGKEGITAELEAMRRIGLGGAHLFTVGGYPPVPNPKVPCLSPAWHAMVRHAAAECERLGLALTAQNCAGWSTAGGPWITPDRAMFHVVCERQSVTNGGAVKLAAPPSWPVTGKTFYRDIAVLAFPTPPAYCGAAVLPAPKVTAGFGEGVDPGLLNRTEAEAKKSAAAVCGVASNRTGWVRFEFPEAVTCRSVSILGGGRECIEPEEHRPSVWASEDGQAFRKVAQLATFVCVYNCAEDSVTHAIPATRARFFRLVWDGPVKVSLKRVAWGGEPVITAHKAQVGDEGRTMVSEPELPEEAGEAVDPGQIREITGQLDAQGNLVWTAPAGAWTVLRVGFRGTGRGNAPAPKEAQGPECDKFDRETVAFHFDNYIGRILAEARAAKSKAMKGVLVDSWEAGTQNWSPVFRDEFRKRRGYEVLPYLPAYAGFIVGSRERTRRYLRDARQTGSDLVSENFFGTLKTLGNRHGLRLYAESCGGNGAGVMVADGVQHYLYTDIPMTEAGRPMREAVSAAHLTGKPVVAMEAYTQGGGADWSSHPGNLKSGGDSFFCAGINRIVFHTYAHNPEVDKLSPGPAFWKYGLPFSRGQTWWEPGRAWIAYLSRCQFLLQQGRAVADVLCFYGEEPAGPIPNVFIKKNRNPDAWRELPDGYDFDLLPAEFLIKELSVRRGLLAGPEGAAYRLLVLRDSDRLTPEAAAKIRKLVAAGATVLGPKPSRSPSLSGYPRCDEAVRAIGEEVWGDCDGKAVTRRAFGKGRVFCGVSVAEALNLLQAPPDFTYTCGDANAYLRFIHRRDGDVEIYFVASQGPGPVDVQASFRIGGRQPEIWDPVSGRTRDAAAFRQEGGRTVLPLHFEQGGSVFVIFRRPVAAAAAGAARSNEPALKEALALQAPWAVSFKGWGAPESVVFEKLDNWTERPEKAIRYYSGTAAYRSGFDWSLPVPGEALLDLGSVGVMAEVFLNGTACGIVWTRPYRVDIAKALKPGRNKLEIRVTNTWANRLIGDALLPAAERKTWTTYHGFKADTPVAWFRSGLLGPVTVKIPEAH